MQVKELQAQLETEAKQRAKTASELKARTQTPPGSPSVPDPVFVAVRCACAGDAGCSGGGEGHPRCPEDPVPYFMLHSSQPVIDQLSLGGVLACALQCGQRPGPAGGGAQARDGGPACDLQTPAAAGGLQSNADCWLVAHLCACCVGGGPDLLLRRRGFYLDFCHRSKDYSVCCVLCALCLQYEAGLSTSAEKSQSLLLEQAELTAKVRGLLLCLSDRL